VNWHELIRWMAGVRPRKHWCAKERSRSVHLHNERIYTYRVYKTGVCLRSIIICFQRRSKTLPATDFRMITSWNTCATLADKSIQPSVNRRYWTLCDDMINAWIFRWLYGKVLGYQDNYIQTFLIGVPNKEPKIQAMYWKNIFWQEFRN